MKNGFTLIELALVILIISILATIGIPRFFRQGTSGVERFVTKLNDITFSAAEIARKLGKTQKVSVDIIAKKVELFDIDSREVKMTIEIPNEVFIEDILIDNVTVFAMAGTKLSAYFLINPQGITQNTKIIVLDESLNAKDPSKGRYELVLNPFTSVFNIK